MTDRKREAGAARQVEASITVDAPVEAVWDALTDAAELRRWFPIDARVTPGKGGKIWISWGGDWEMGSDIEIWEPGRHLRTAADQPAPEPGKGSGETLKWASADATDEAKSKAVRVAIDYHLEGKGGKTVLRLVQSGFGPGAEWDDEIDELQRGWAVELPTLRHYLEHHRGRDRKVIWVRRAFDGKVQEGWRRITSPGGLVASGSLEAPEEGGPWSIETATGDRFEGRVLRSYPPHGFAGTVESLGGGVFRLMVMEYYGRCEASLMLAAWGEHAAAVPAFERKWEPLLRRLFP